MKRLPELIKNNRRWAQRMQEDNPEFFSELSEGQQPRYLWIGCSDSRVPANQIVDVPPGTMFVHRNISNQVNQTDLNCQSVIQFAVKNLEVKHIIICGHYGCGGIHAALDENSYGMLDNWLQPIKNLYRDYADELEKYREENEQVFYNKMCELNVRQQVNNICQSPSVQESWGRDRELHIHGWMYELKSGLIKDLSYTLSSYEDYDNIFNNR